MFFHFLIIVWNVLNFIFQGFVIKTFWAWFIVSQFPNLPMIQVLPAIGFCLFVRCIVPWITTSVQLKDLDVELKEQRDIKNAKVGTISNILFLIFGWVVHYFM